MSRWTGRDWRVVQVSPVAIVGIHASNPLLTGWIGSMGGLNFIDLLDLLIVDRFTLKIIVFDRPL